mgnify:CR=1 FL=1
MTTTQARSTALLQHTRLYGGKLWASMRRKDTGGRRYRYLRHTAKHGWKGEHVPWAVTRMPEWRLN